MAFANLIISQSSEIDGIIIDGMLSETTSQTMVTTTNPLENGVLVTDHVVEQPRTFALQGIITNTPLMGAGFIDGLVTNVAYELGGVVSRVSGLIGSSLPSGTSRSQQGYNSLRALMLAKKTITIKTNLGDIEDLIFTSLTISQDKDSSNAILFSATFVEILIVRQNIEGVDSTKITDAGTAAALASQTNFGNSTGVLLSSARETSFLNSSTGVLANL